MNFSTQYLATRNQNRSTVVCRHGIACTSQPLASMAAVDILKAGGTAVDAAIAADAMLSLVEPMNCGPGGDLFAIVWDEGERRLSGLNASGRAPYDWNLDKAHALGLTAIPPYAPLSWNVPGCVSGWQALHGRFGKARLNDILAPVISYSREGFPVSPVIASDWEFNAQDHPTLAEIFAPDGRQPGFGDVFRNERLADFYETLLGEGLDSFYKGEIAERIVKFSQANGGYFSLRDFAEHTADWVDPVCTNYHGFDIWEIPPNGQGICVLQMLNILEQFDLFSMKPDSAEYLHLLIEAKRLAYEDRAKYYADPKFADVPIEWLISKDYGKKRATLIDPKCASESVQAGSYKDAANTIYLTVADAAGNMVSFIQSLYHGWGSHIVPDHLGFALQNRGESFALDPSHRNKLEPHKRPFHTIIPAFITQHGQPKFSFGVMGGDFQPQGHVQVALNVLDFHLPPQEAGELPRIEHSGSSSQTGGKATGKGIVRCEVGISNAIKDQLRAMGHDVAENPGVFGGYQGIWREEEPRRWFGGSDPRKDGLALGY